MLFFSRTKKIIDLKECSKLRTKIKKVLKIISETKSNPTYEALVEHFGDEKELEKNLEKLKSELDKLLLNAP